MNITLCIVIQPFASTFPDKLDAFGKKLTEIFLGIHAKESDIAVYGIDISPSVESAILNVRLGRVATVTKVCRAWLTEWNHEFRHSFQYFIFR